MSQMNLPLVLAFLFFIGSVFGWILELFYRRFFSGAKPERKWINPGFCVGPYLPLYGSGLCILFLLAELEQSLNISNTIVKRLILFAIMAVCMTAIEYIAGIVSLKCFNLRLWDYRDQWGNIQGIICPKFSFFWAVMGAAYYFLIHPKILGALGWLSKNLAFSFFIGLFFGIFIIDVAYSSNIVLKIRRFAAENNVIVRYENLKAHIRSFHDKNSLRSHFFLAMRSEKSIQEHLRDIRDRLEKRAVKK